MLIGIVADHHEVGYVDVFKLLQLVAQVFELKTEGAGENSMIVSEFWIEALIHVWLCVLISVVLQS